MKIDIQKQLETASNKDKEIIDFDPVKEVKLLLEGESLEDARILRNLSNSSQFNRIEEINGKHLHLKNLEKLYDGQVYTIEQIEKLAIDFNLRFLKSQYYSGSFDVEVIAKLKEFSKNTKTEINDWNLKNDYYILAPEKMFELKEVRHITKKELDPALFFKIDETHYRLIHKWGNDFSVFRYLSGFRWKSYIQHAIYNTFIVAPVFSLLFAVLLPVSFIIQYFYLLPLFILLTSWGFAYFRWGWGKLDEWDVIDKWFTPNNWNSYEKTIYKWR